MEAKIIIGELTKEGRVYLQQLSGIEFKETVSFLINTSDLKHVYKRHYKNNEKDLRNIPLNEETIGDIVEVIIRPSKIVFLGTEENKGSKFAFISETTEGSYTLIEVYSSRRGNLTAKTFFHTKKEVGQRAMDIPQHTTSEMTGALFDAKIPILFDITNEKVKIIKEIIYQTISV